MDDLAAFRERYPLQTMRLPDGEPFTYRYHRNPIRQCNDCAPAGRNRAVRLFCLHFERFAEDCSVITFDYQKRLAKNAELARASASGSGRFA